MTSAAAGSTPLWLAIEGKIAELGSADFDDRARETTVHRIAAALDQEGYNVSHHAANMMLLRRAAVMRQKVGRPFLTDYTAAVEALTLDDVANPIQATIAFAHRVGADFPEVKDLDRRGDLRDIIEGVRLDLMVAKAGELGGDKGIRYLIGERVAESVILARLGIDQAKLDGVKAAIAAELAETERVRGLLKEVEGKDDLERVKHLINKEVSAESIVAIAGIAQATIDAAKKAMEEELREKERLAAEAAAAKKAAAEGPKIEDIPPAEMLAHIEAIREIMEFSSDPAEIAAMCGQSNIPKALVEIATSNPDKLDELEAAAGG
ncbi:MAG: hypothetical protein MUC56_05620 [Thermoanaerobaculales bacterium]|jgi:hypothetical protein|nr:hypothetical protein [Thermoanaerobaculales bacterium]